MDSHRDLGRPDPDEAEAGAQQAAQQKRLLALLLPIHDRARRTARRLCSCAADGDDLFQEAVLRALAHLPSLREEARFAGWFYAVMISVHRARSRVSFWRRFLPLESVWARTESAPPQQPAWSPAVAEQTRERAARLAQALKHLPPEQREAVVLFEVEGFSIEEIAEMQGASQTAVKTRLRRGRERLRRHYEELGLAEDAGTESTQEPPPAAAASGAVSSAAARPAAPPAATDAAAPRPAPPAIGSAPPTGRAAKEAYHG